MRIQDEGAEVVGPLIAQGVLPRASVLPLTVLIAQLAGAYTEPA